MDKDESMSCPELLKPTGTFISPATLAADATRRQTAVRAAIDRLLTTPATFHGSTGTVSEAALFHITDPV